jgi:hypothetical protein
MLSLKSIKPDSQETSFGVTLNLGEEDRKARGVVSGQWQANNISSVIN